MKRILLSVVAAFAALTTMAEQRMEASFLQVPAIIITNTVGVTNLSSFVNTYATNMNGFFYTNVFGTRVGGTFTTNTSAQNLFRDIPLWKHSQAPVWLTNAAAADSFQQTDSAYQIAIVVGPHGGTASTANFVFKPLISALPGGGGTGYEWTVSVAAGAAAAGDTLVITNVPAWKWPGASALRLESAYVTAGASKSNVIKGVYLLGWQ